MDDFDDEKCENFCANNGGDAVGNEDVYRLYRIVSRLLFLLEEKIEGAPPFEGIEEIFGSRENVISVITKLTQILMKITPLLTVEDTDEVSSTISEEDQKIVEAFIERYNASRG